MLGSELTHWTIRLALIGFGAALTLALLPGNERRFFWYRLSWSVGCLFFLLHVVCAFQFFYHWSHRFAVEQTARKTSELMGVAFGNGIWFSYLFGAVWLADVAWAWAWPASYQQRSRPATMAIVGYLCFIAFQGAVVFEGGVVRYASLLATALLLLSLGWLHRPQWRRSKLLEGNVRQ